MDCDPALERWGRRAGSAGVLPSPGAQVAELTSLVGLPGYPDGTRLIVRRERPHPGAQLSLFDQDEGMRHQMFLTDTGYDSGGSIQYLEVRHRGHATVEDHIHCGKDTGLGRFPARHFPVNTAWLELSLAPIDLLTRTRTLLLDGSPPPSTASPHYPAQPPDRQLP
jgi:hypothetical protein